MRKIERDLFCELKKLLRATRVQGWLLLVLACLLAWLTWEWYNMNKQVDVHEFIIQKIVGWIQHKEQLGKT